MEELELHIQKIKELRRIPQLIFFYSVTTTALLSLIEIIQQYKREEDNYDGEIDVILHSKGGSPHDAYRIVKVLREFFSKINIIIPFYAKSAATLIALGGHTVIFGYLGELGPLDAQINEQREDGIIINSSSALIEISTIEAIESRYLEFFENVYDRLSSNLNNKFHKKELVAILSEHLPKFYEPLIRQITPFTFGENYRSLKLGEFYAEAILREFHDIDSYNEDSSIIKTQDVVNFLVWGLPDHEAIIDHLMLGSVYPDWMIKAKDIEIENYEEHLNNVTMFLINAENEPGGISGHIKFI